jgi:GNAT superfamily N-acetyltransferase
MIYKDKGYISQFEMDNPTQGKEKLLTYINELKKSGHKRIVAPLNGSTWHDYRLVSFTNELVSPFPLEPNNPLWYNQVYTDLGFKPLQKYYSEIFPLDNTSLINKTVDKPVDKSVNIHNFDVNNFKSIYDIANASFVDNFMYTPISFEEFDKIYSGPLQSSNNDYIALAYVDNEPVGFIFSFAFNNTLILKSLAVLPSYRSLGIGASLIAHVCNTAKNNGINKAIGALISTGNHSGNIVSAYGGEVFREYTLYEHTYTP